MSHSVWDGVDRRESNAPISAPGSDGDMWRYVIGQLESTNAKLGAIHMDMIEHKANMHHLHVDVEEIKKAFPKAEDGERDYYGHHSHHDGIIRTSKRWSDIGQDVAKKVFTGVTWVVFVFIALAIWEKFRASLGLPPKP
jgi:hypothetical protein